jgi:hypothetical protein
VTRALQAGIATALAAVAVAAVTAFLLLGRDPGSDPSIAGDLRVQGTLAPRIALFGDTVRAAIDVTLDRSRVDPESVRLAADFSPWKIVGKPVESRRDAGNETHLLRAFVLRCLTEPCVPSGRAAPIQFEPARMSYAASAGRSAERRSVEVTWPGLLVYSRSSSAGVEPRTGRELWRADLVSLPGVSYRIAPGFLLALLLFGSALLSGTGLLLAYRAWPRRSPAPPPEPVEPEPVFEQTLSPLEQALLLLEESVRADGPADQRRALELVAEELELAEWGDPELGRTARVLAWSEEIPHVSATSDLAARVRSALDASNEGSHDGNGRVA